MIRLVAAAALLLSAAAPPADEASRDEDPQTALVTLVQITMQQIIIRVPRAERRVPAASGLVAWRETSGPRCIPAREIAGAMPATGTVDLLMRDNRRIRARLGRDCPALDYYRGLYLAANRDGMVCAGRDTVRSRMGGQCDIVQFRLLQRAAR